MGDDKFQKQLESSRRDKGATEVFWDLCRLMLAGKQFVAYNRYTDRLQVAEHDEGFYADNQIKPLWRHVIAGLLVEYPNPSVLPASPSTEDILKARAGLEALRYSWNVSKMKPVTHEVIRWMGTTGNGAYHTYYDKEQKLVLSKAVSPYDINFQMGVQDQFQSGWDSVRTMVDKEELADLYSKHADDIMDMDDAKGGHSLPVLGLSSPEGQVEVFDVYYRTGPKKGTHEYRLLDRVLDEEEFNPKTTPVRHVVYMRTPGMMWGDGLVGDVIDLQVQLNKANRRIARHLDVYSDPYVKVPIGSAVPVNAFRQGSSKIIPYSPAHGGPDYMLGPPLTPEAAQEPMRIITRMLDVAGVHSTSLGKTARGVTSAKQVDALKSADASQLTGTQEGLEAACVDVMKTQLVLMKEHYPKSKWVAQLDATGGYVHAELSSTDLTDDPEIILEAGALFRNETQDRRRRTLEYYGAGLIDAEDAMQEIGMGTSGKYVIDQVEALSHANELKEAAIQGFDVRVYATDKLSAVRRVFEEYINGEDFYRMPLENQEHFEQQYLKIVRLITQRRQQKAVMAHKPELAGIPGQAVPTGPAQVPGMPAETELPTEDQGGV